MNNTKELGAQLLNAISARAAAIKLNNETCANVWAREVSRLTNAFYASMGAA